ncbi:DNA segment, Chr 11, Wayne State University 47, expressed [Sigmodon hispidus]
MKAGGETKDQNQPSSIQERKHTKPKVALRKVTTPRSHASDATSPKRDHARDVTGSKESLCHSLETEPSLVVSSVEPVLSNQDRKHSSAQPRDKPAISASPKLDKVDPQRQKLLAKLLDMPTNDCHSQKNGSHGVQRGRPSMLSIEAHLSGVSPALGNTEPQEKSESLHLALHTAPLGEAQATEQQEPRLGIELCHSKGNTENSVSATEVQEQAYVGRGAKDPISPTKAKTEAALALLNIFTPLEGTSSKLLSVPELGRQHPTSLAVKSPPEGKAQFYGQNEVPAITLLVKSKRDVLEPTSFCQPHAAQTGYNIPSYSAGYPVSKSSLVSHVAAADSEAPPRSMGLEWFPELYPGYVGLGVLPWGPQHWHSVAQMPFPATSQGASVSKVPWLGRSSADSRSSEPLALTTSSFPLTRLLGAVHEGWVRCNTTIKKRGVGGLTMLFAGYFILCCSWSFKHLSKLASSVA